MPDSRRSAQSPLASWWRSYPGDYIEPGDDDWAVVPVELEAFSEPRGFAEWINDGGVGISGRDLNCADCARALELSWRGEPQVSAARAPERGGELLAQIERWLGTELDEHTFEAIGERLKEAGHGASAYIVVYWNGGGAHAFNGVMWNGEVYWIDAQPGALVAPWPPHKSLSTSAGYDETDVMIAFAAFRDEQGSSI